MLRRRLFFAFINSFYLFWYSAPASITPILDEIHSPSLPRTHGGYPQPEVEREDALAEDDDVHVQRLEVRRAVRVLVERAEAHEVVVPEELDLLARLLHEDVLCRQRVDGEHLRAWL